MVVWIRCKTSNSSNRWLGWSCSYWQKCDFTSNISNGWACVCVHVTLHCRSVNLILTYIFFCLIYLCLLWLLPSCLPLPLFCHIIRVVVLVLVLVFVFVRSLFKLLHLLIASTLIYFCTLSYMFRLFSFFLSLSPSLPPFRVYALLQTIMIGICM